MLSCVQFFGTLWIGTLQSPLSGVGSHSLLQEDLDSEIEPGSPALQVDSLPAEHQESESEVTQLCPTHCEPMDCSLPGFSVHGIFQASIPEWVAFSFSRGSSWPRYQTQFSHIAGRRFTLWVTREAQGTRKTLLKALRSPVVRAEGNQAVFCSDNQVTLRST